MKQYELLIVLPGTLEESAVPGMIDEVKTIVEKHGGTNISTQNRGKSRLAYPMRHIRYGYFGIILFTAEGNTIPEVQKELSLRREFLRAIVTTFDPAKRAETEKKLGRTHEGPVRTLSSVFERFGGDVKKDDVEVKEEVAPEKEETQSESSEPAPEAAEEPAPTLQMEDIDKKLDQLLEDDLKQV